MRNLFLLVVLACLRVAWTLTEGTPNCPVAGNWSDSEGTKTLSAWSADSGNGSIVHHMELNMGDYKITHENSNASKAVIMYNSTAFVVLLANATGPNNYTSTEKTIVELICANNLLYVDIVPASDISTEETEFALRRQRLPPLNEAPQVPPASSPSNNPQVLLVNITLKGYQEDDSHEYKDEFEEC